MTKSASMTNAAARYTSIIGFMALAACSADSEASSSGASGGGGESTGGTNGSTGGASGTGAATSATGGAVSGTGGAQSGTGGATGTTGGTTSTGGTTGSGGTIGTGGTITGTGGATSASYEEVQGWIDAYKAAHPGQDGDINAKTPEQIAADPAAQQLLSLCGPNQRPVIPQLAWEYGGGDHAWINPEASALVYCVYIPVQPSTDHWAYDAATDHVTADVYVLFPDQNPCKDEIGANQVMNCLGDATNIEILVDTASLNDGIDAGLNLAESSTELRLVLPDGMKVHMYDGL